MSKSKLVNANQKIEEKVVKTYKKIEDGAVGSFTKISDKFIDKYLAKNGETTDEAKKRIQEEQEKLKHEKKDLINKHHKDYK